MTATLDRVQLTDVSLRDGLQDEKFIVSTDAKIAIAEALIRAGVVDIEATSFVHPKWVPQLADADVLIPRLPVGPEYSALVLNERGIERGIAAFGNSKIDAKHRSLLFVASASARHNMANNNRTIDETLELFDAAAAKARAAGMTLLGAIACSFVSPWADEQIDPATVVGIAKRYAAGGVQAVTLADTVGRASPRDVAKRVEQVSAEVTIPLSLHLHDSSGYALANVYAGLERGVRRFEAALAGLGGCPWAPGAPGNLDMEKLTAFLEACGCETGIDRDGLTRAAAVITEALAHATPIETTAAAH